jgi:hypothetical protein
MVLVYTMQCSSGSLLECAVLFCLDFLVPRFLRFWFVRLERAVSTCCKHRGLILDFVRVGGHFIRLLEMQG